MKSFVVQNRFFGPDVDSYGGLFDDEALSGAVVKSENDGGGNPDMYSPSVTDSKVKGGEWKSTLRFVPFAANVALSKIKKFVYFFENGTEKFYVDCTSNLDSRKRNIISEAYFFTNKHDSAQLRKISNLFKRKIYYWSPVLILEDAQYPELVGKIKIFRYGNQINDLIVKEGEEKAGRTKVNVFNPFTGKDLYLIVKKDTFQDKNTGQTQEMVSYGDSYFGENRTTLILNGTSLESTVENQKIIHEFLLANTPDMQPFQAKAWDEETEAKVVSTVRDIIGNTQVFNEIYKKVYNRQYTGQPAAAPAAAQGDSYEMKAEMVDKLANNTTQKAAPVTTSAPVTSEAPAAESQQDGGGLPFAVDDDIPDFDFEGLPEN